MQIEIPLCKLSSNTNLSLAADGDPVTVDMSLRAMRKHDGTLVKFTYYDVDKNCLVPFDAEYIGPEPPVPEISTKVVPKEIEFDDSTSSVTITDTISYINFIDGEYSVVTRVMNRTTLQEIISYTTYKTIQAGSGDIQIEVSVPTNKSSIECVVYESIFRNRELYVEHVDKDDEAQQFTLTYNPPSAPQVKLTIQSPLDTELYCLPKDCQPPYNGEVDTYVHFEGTLDTAAPARDVCSILYTNEDQTPIDPADLENLIANTTITIEEVTES